MKILRSVAAFKRWRRGVKGSLGFVPTMGALHAGHARLVQCSLARCEITVASIFVNPTQFNNAEDLEKYPHTIAQDLTQLRALGIDAVFLPTRSMIYPEDYRFQVRETVESKILCGEFRPGHFDGVLTVVLKLLNIVHPTHAFFGEKDFQQLKLIRDMVDAFFLDCKIVAVPTVRARSGLALSSRNLRLSAAAKTRAVAISQLLKNRRLSAAQVRKALQRAGLRVDYVEDHWQRRFVAAHIDNVRLIDNAAL